ncbi:MAG: AAA family ATPase, partial [Bdellovibrionota bacterium]
MQLVELVVQGVRRFSASQKIGFRPGLNVLLGPNESGKSTLAECVRSLLYPQSVSDGSGFVSPESPQVSRAALTFTSADGATWRILRDYVTGNATLAKLNPEAKKFETAESGAAAVEAKVRELGAPSFDLFEAVYFLKADRAPWLSGGGSAAAPVASPGAWGGGGGDQNRFFEGSAVDVPDENLTPDQMQEKIETLKRELESSEKLAKLQFELDGVEAKKFEAENKLSALKELDGKVSQAKGELRAYEDVADIDPALEQRLTRYEQASKTHNQEMVKLDERKTQLEGESQAAKSSLEPVY